MSVADQRAENLHHVLGRLLLHEVVEDQEPGVADLVCQRAPRQPPLDAAHLVALVVVTVLDLAPQTFYVGHRLDPDRAPQTAHIPESGREMGLPGPRGAVQDESGGRATPSRYGPRDPARRRVPRLEGAGRVARRNIEAGERQARAVLPLEASTRLRRECHRRSFRAVRSSCRYPGPLAA